MNGGALRELLVGLIAHGERPIIASTGAASRCEWRTGRRALRLGRAELVEDEGPLPRSIVAGGLRLVRITSRGREYLGIPGAASLGDREPLDVLRDAVRILMGGDGFVLAAPPADWTGPTMIALANHHLLDGGWDERIDAISVIAGEQGVVGCQVVALHDGCVGWVLAGFEAVDTESKR